jgi:hypothetical protein
MKFPDSVMKTDIGVVTLETLAGLIQVVPYLSYLSTGVYWISETYPTWLLAVLTPIPRFRKGLVNNILQLGTYRYATYAITCILTTTAIFLFTPLHLMSIVSVCVAWCNHLERTYSPPHKQSELAPC